MSERYFVDERAGCIAVRDRQDTDPDYPGLHFDTKGVVKYWHGYQVPKVCPTCGHHGSGSWELHPEDRIAAYELCNELNAKETGK